MLMLLAALAVSIPMVTGPLPVTTESYPFMAANRSQTPMDLSKAGYVEEEFLVSGTANVYDWAPDGRVTVKTANAPYTTRILVRRPADPARFSGNVIVETFNNARNYDWSFIWPLSYEYFIERGDAFVGLTHTPQAIAALKKFDPKRYETLSFANPNPGEKCGAQQTVSDAEEGLRWDVISQVGALLKSKAAGAPLSGFNVQYVYATSHTAELLTYVNSVHPLANVYDGFVLKSEYNPVERINRCSAAPSNGDPRQIVRNAKVPVIRVTAQGDVLNTFTVRRNDSDESNDRYRLYEVAGAPHMDKIFYQHMPVVQDQAKAGQPTFLSNWPLAYACNPSIDLADFPLMRYTMNAAFADIDQWVRKGIPAPRAARIEVENGGTPQARFVADQYGNAIGGVRSVYLDVPAATYSPNSPGQAVCANLLHKTPFNWTRLESVYGTSKNYAAKASEAVDRLVKERWLTESDAKRIKVELIRDK
jgi:hypothetical protein